MIYLKAESNITHEINKTALQIKNTKAIYNFYYKKVFLFLFDFTFNIFY